MRRRYDDFRQAGAEVALVSFAQGEPLRLYASDLDLPFPVLSDSERQAYRAYSLARGRWWELTDLKTVCSYGRLILRGRWSAWANLLRRRQLFPSARDPYQLGGDFIIDATGTIRFAYRSRSPADRPSVDRLLQAVGRLTGP